jgi:hypothetical protein
MDWPISAAFCRAVAEALGVLIYMSWKEGGFRREMLRDGTPTAPSWFETPDGLRHAGGESDKVGNGRACARRTRGSSTRTPPSARPSARSGSR